MRKKRDGGSRRKREREGEKELSAHFSMHFAFDRTPSRLRSADQDVFYLEVGKCREVPQKVCCENLTFSGYFSFCRILHAVTCISTKVSSTARARTMA